MTRATSLLLTLAQAAAGLGFIAVLVALPVGRAAAVEPASAAGPNLDIAAIDSDVYGEEIGSAWLAPNMAPGDRVTGSVKLRVSGVDDPTLGLNLTVVSAREPGRLERALRVTEASLRGQSLLPAWSACAAGQQLTLADLATCEAVAAIRPSAQGDVFTMTVELAAEAGDELQAASTGNLRFEFHLAPLFAATPTTTPPAGGPGEGAPVPGASATPAPTGTVAGEAPSSATPRPPSTGMGYFPQGEQPNGRLFLAAGLGAVWLVLSVVAAVHRRSRRGQAKARTR